MMDDAVAIGRGPVRLCAHLAIRRRGGRRRPDQDDDPSPRDTPTAAGRALHHDAPRAREARARARLRGRGERLLCRGRARGAPRASTGRSRPTSPACCTAGPRLPDENGRRVRGTPSRASTSHDRAGHRHVDRHARRDACLGGRAGAHGRARLEGLPRHRRAARASARRLASSEPGVERVAKFDNGDVHVLVVDDSLTIRYSLRDLLELQGYRVSLAATRDEALAAARRDALRHRRARLLPRGDDRRRAVPRSGHRPRLRRRRLRHPDGNLRRSRDQAESPGRGRRVHVQERVERAAADPHRRHRTVRAPPSGASSSSGSAGSSAWSRRSPVPCSSSTPPDTSGT